MKNKFLRALCSVLLVTVLMLAMSVPAYAAGSLNLTLSQESVSATSGSSFTLTANATYSLQGGETTSTPTYLWTVASTGVTATGSSISVQANGNDTITCVASGTITDASGNVQQVSATRYCTVTVTTPTPTPAATVNTPTITSNPASATLKSGQTATLSVGATVANLNNGVTLQYQWYYTANSNGSNAQAIPGANSNTYTTVVTNTTYYYFAAVRATNGTTTSSVVYSNLAKVSYNDGTLKVTKNPTGETVDAGGSATFIARADNAASFEWRIVSKDTTKTIKAKEASSYFKGLTVSGTNSDTLVLSNIPASMNEWSVECKFIASDGKTYVCTTGAVIKVKGASSSSSSGSASASASPSASSYVPGASASPSATATTKPDTGDTSLSAPTISTQPVGATLTEGETTTLSVSAAASDTDEGAEMKYQWYRNDTNSNTGGTAIGGAQSATYKPDTISGTKYYYVGVWSTDGTHQSKVVFSSPVAVTYTSSTASPSPSPDAEDDDADGGSSLTSVILPVIGMVVAAAAIGIGVFFLLKNAGSGKKKNKGYGNYDDYDDDYKT